MNYLISKFFELIFIILFIVTLFYIIYFFSHSDGNTEYQDMINQAHRIEECYKLTDKCIEECENLNKLKGTVDIEIQKLIVNCQWDYCRVLDDLCSYPENYEDLTYDTFMNENRQIYFPESINSSPICDINHVIKTPHFSRNDILNNPDTVKIFDCECPSESEVNVRVDFFYTDLLAYNPEALGHDEFYDETITFSKVCFFNQSELNYDLKYCSLGYHDLEEEMKKIPFAIGQKRKIEDRWVIEDIFLNENNYDLLHGTIMRVSDGKIYYKYFRRYGNILFCVNDNKEYISWKENNEIKERLDEIDKKLDGLRQEVVKND